MAIRLNLPPREAVEPRGMTRVRAAAYCGVSTSTFDEWRARGLVPGPLSGTKRWDRRAIDAALDRASGLTQPARSAYDEWKAQDARAAGGDPHR